MPLFGPPDVAGLRAKGDVQGLIRALGYTGDPAVRRAAAQALGQLGDARAVEPLSLALRNLAWQQDWHDIAAATEALGRLGAPAVPALMAALQFHSQVVRVGATEALSTIGKPAVAPLIGLLGDADLEIREIAGQVLNSIGEESVEPLIAALHDPSTGRRVRAAKVLGDIQDKRAIQPLIGALRDAYPGVRQSAARALGNIPDASVIGPLVAALSDPDPTTRKVTALALGNLGNANAIPTLIPELKGIEWQAAVEALVRIGTASVEPLISSLADSKARGDTPGILENLRSSVAVTLTRMGYPQELAALVTQLYAEPRNIRAEAAAELIRLYQAGGLDRRARELILQVRPIIERPHDDARTDETHHTDEGIGAPFPV